MKRPKGFMSIETFQKILDELGDSLIFVILYGWGEPFLNKDLPKMIGACTKLNIRTVTSTNGNTIRNLDDALRVVDAELSALVIAIDGSTQEVYRTYRKGGDIENVKRCVSLVEEAKALRGARFPYTNLRAVVTRYNRDDLPNVEKLARDLEVDMFSYKSVGCLTQSEKYGDYEPAEKKMRRYEYDGTSKRRRHFIKCPYPFRQPTVFWDGSVVGCEFDYELEVPWGKIGARSFGEIWNSRSALNMRHCIQRGENLPAFCGLCPYQDRVQDSCVLSHVILRPIDNETEDTKRNP
jgi:MoaA/NifB/PqqE/SkfB family radical SAM enzyme